MRLVSRREKRLETDAAEGAETLPSNILPLPRAEALTVGADLRRAREAAGLSLAAVADRTKVRPGILTAIEEDAHDRLPALTYTIGFVKAYARTVGLDPDAAADRYRRESRKGEPVPLLVDVEPLEARRLPGPVLLWTSGILVAALLAVLAAWGFGAFSGPLPDEPKVAAVDPLPTAPSALPDTSAGATATSAGATATDPSTPAGGPVRLTAKDDVWIRVSDPAGGPRFFEGTLSRGQSLDIPPGRALVLRAGRAGALEVRIGATLLPPLGGEGEVLAAQSLDPQALRAAAAPRGGLADAPPPAP
jgi:transcriptional regulator with XRE-family HTH domain